MTNSAVNIASAEIDINDAKDIWYWCRELRCRQSDLIAAVIGSGTTVPDVEKYVRRRAAIARSAPNDPL